MSSSFVSGSLSVVANNLCGSSSAKTLALSSTPFAPGTITGTSNNLCPNGVSNPTYSIAVVAGASSYTWTAPVGTSIVSGQGTTSVTLEVSSSFVSGTLSVIANNLCGSSTAKSLALSSIPPAPGIITGASNNLCLNGVSNPTYTILAVAGASSYTWTAPVGTTIVSGQGTTSVTLEVSGSFVSGNLSVIANNQCGSSTAKTLALSSIPPAPGIITGPSNNLCLNGVSNPTYTISAVAGASSYTWTAPIGTTIVSGQGTTSVTLAVSGSFVSGPLTVKSNNSCSSSISRTLALYSVPLTPASITGSAAPCGTTTYSCAAVSQAVSYTWTVPAGLEIESGQGTNTITVNVVSSNVTGSITVKASNNCKTGAAKSMVVSSCTSRLMLTSTEETITNNNTNRIEAIVYPNPTNGEVNIEFSSELESNVKVELYDMIGNKVSRVGILAGNTIGNLTLEDMTSGMYFLQVVNSNNDIIYKSKVSKQ